MAKVTSKAATKPTTRKKTAPKLADARARMYHDLIFECAETVFGRKGYDGATMQDIADEAGVSLKTLYAAFENKQDLYDQIMRERADAFVVAMRATVDESQPPLERLERLVRAYVGFLFEHENWFRIHLRSRIAWAFRPSDEGVAVSWSEAQEVYSRVLRDGMKLGEIYEGNAAEMTMLVHSMMQALMALAIEADEKDPADVADGMLMHIRRLVCPR